MALLHRSKLLLAFVLLALLVTVAPDRIEAQEGSEFQLRVRKSADVSNDSVEIIISTDRQLREVPKVYVTRVIDEEGTAPVFTTNRSGETVPIDGPRGPVRHTGLNFYEYVHSSPESGLYSVYVEAEDINGSRTTAGSATSAAAAASITFELDKTFNGGEVPTFVWYRLSSFDVAADVTADVLEVEAYEWLSVTADFSREAGEYLGDRHESITLTSARLEVEFRNGSKESTHLNLEHRAGTRNLIHSVSLTTRRVGSYTLTVKARDAAGNNSSKDGYVFRWNVVPIRPVIIDLAPGWNLISLPFRPGNPGINTIVPANNPADIVMTFDNESRVWMVSRRDPQTGLFSGDITWMTADRAYFVRTDSSQGLSLYRPPPCTLCHPPPLTITVVGGWNLVPVVTNRIPHPPPTTIPADYYFGTLGDNSWLKALTFNTPDQTWESVSPGETLPDGDDEDTEPDMATLTVGKGYWLYATQDGVIIP